MVPKTFFVLTNWRMLPLSGKFMPLSGFEPATGMSQDFSCIPSPLESSVQTAWVRIPDQEELFSWKKLIAKQGWICIICILHCNNRNRLLELWTLKNPNLQSILDQFYLVFKVECSIGHVQLRDISASLPIHQGLRNTNSWHSLGCHYCIWLKWTVDERCIPV